MHFLVDGLCVCCLYLSADARAAGNLLWLFLLYNVLAFLTQPFTGMAADRYAGRLPVVLATSVLLLSLGVLTNSLLLLAGNGSSWPLPVIQVALLGMGNSLFHVWGGKLTAHATGNDIRALGLFVSTGAFGLTVGFVCRSAWLPCAMLLLVVFCSIVLFHHPQQKVATDYTTGEEGWWRKEWLAWTAMLLLMAAVMLRSGASELFTAGIERTSATVLVIGAVAMTGKMGGGWMARCCGLLPTLLCLLICIGICLFLRNGNLPLALSGLLLVNGTMAITLYLANRVFPGKEGLAFGLLAAALMPGYLLYMAGGDAANALPSLLLALLPTIGIEAGVLWLLREERADVLCASVMVNMLTNVTLNLYLLYIHNSMGTIVTGELLVVLAEAGWYVYFTRSWRLSFAYSLLCNATSFFVGAFVQVLLLL